jgi:outer membrane receptor protein involved in Fe transport
MIPYGQLLKAYPQYGTVVRYRNNVGTTRYQGVEFSLRQRLSRGLTYSVAYTRSKLVDDASSVFDATVLTGPVANFAAADSFDRSRERDYSNGDIPHIFVSSIVWDLPAGTGRARQVTGPLGAIVNDWTVTSIVTMQSGTPVAVTQANANSAWGFGTQRPNLVGDPTLPADQRTPSQWFNTAAFSVAPVFTLGSASRNPVRGPSYRDVDFALMRRVPLGRSQAVEIRAEVFNLFNTPNLGIPNAVAGASNFGTITTALDPRVVQLAVKFLF